MKDFTDDFESRYEMPTQQELERLMVSAHRMRHEALRDGLVAFWGLLHRNIEHKRAARHA